MPLIDITVPVSLATTEWPGDTPFSCGWSWDMSAGASVNVSRITMSPHTGTHADAPLHVTLGAAGADALPLDIFHGAVSVVDVSDQTGELDAELLSARLAGDTPMRLLLKTGRTIVDGPFPNGWPALSRSCAETLVARGLRLLGVDCPSVDGRHSMSLDVHHALFDRDAYVLENLDLRAVTAGRYELLALPMKFVGLDAAPVRAVLRW